MSVATAPTCDLLNSLVPDVCNHTSSKGFTENHPKKKYQAMTELDNIESCIKKLMDKTASCEPSVKSCHDNGGTESCQISAGLKNSAKISPAQFPEFTAQHQDCKTHNPSDNRLSLSEEKITLTQNTNVPLVRKNSLRLVTRSPAVRRRSTPIGELDRTWALNQCEELTTWVNLLLQQRDTALTTDLKKAICDGRTLPLLLDVMQIGTSFGVDSENSTLTQQEQFDRTRKCIDLLKSSGYSCSDVTASDIVNGDLKSVILYLSGLKNFHEKRITNPADTVPSSPDAEVEMLRKSPGVTRRAQSRERISQPIGPRLSPSKSAATEGTTSHTKEGSVSDRIKWLLNNNQSTAINVDSGEKEVTDKRQQPLGESDSAASPGYEERGKNPLSGVSGEHRLKESDNSNTSPYHRQDTKMNGGNGYSTMQPLSRNKPQQHPSHYNNSVPNINSYKDSERVQPQPRANTPTYVSNKLSVYSDNQKPANDRMSRPPVANERPPRSTSANRSSVSPSRLPVYKGHPVPLERRPEIYPPSAPNPARSPYSQRRQLQLPTNNQSHYETIDDVQNQTAKMNTQDQHIEKRGNPPDYYSTLNARYNQHNRQPSPSRPIPHVRPEETTDSLPPDETYEMRNPASPRRSSMPSVKYHPSNNKTKQVMRDLQTAPAMISQYEENEDDPDYVDISDAAVNSDNDRSSTPPLPAFLDDNSDAESCSSANGDDAAYKYRRSVSASGKMLSAGVETFQRMMKESKTKSSAKKRSSLAEETDENDSKPATPPIRKEQKGVVRPMMKSDQMPLHVNQSAPSTHHVQPMQEIKADDIYSEDDSSLSEDDPDSPSQPERGVYITDQSAAIMRPSSRQSRRPTSMPMAHARRDNGTAKPEKIDRKVQKLERLYEDMSQYLTTSRHQTSHNRRDYRRHSIASASSSQYSYSHKHRRSKNSSESRSINRRFHRLESHIVTLAKSIGHLSTEVKTQNSIFMEIDRLGHDLEVVKRQMHSMSLEKSNNHINADDSAQRQPHMLPSAQSNGHAIENLAARATTDGNPQKISKLTRLKSSFRQRFFGHEPPLMKLFLKQLGYEKYQAIFDSEKIGMLELPFMSEERLRVVGIPLGPRVRILQEAARLCKNSPQRTKTAMISENRAIRQ